MKNEYTWRDVVGETDIEGNVYVIFDSVGCIIYVGRSRDIKERLLQHTMNMMRVSFDTSSPVGEYIKANLPDSLDWKIETYQYDWNVYEIREAQMIRSINPYFNTMLRCGPAQNPCPAPKVFVPLGHMDDLLPFLK